MAFVIEDGSQKPDANSYVTEAGYNAYIGKRVAGRSNPTSALTESYIYKATDYFESLYFQGYKASEAQALQWPRNGVLIDGWGQEGNEIPVQVVTAIYELAYGFEQGFGISDPVSRETQTETVGGVSVTYKNSSADRTLTPATTQALRKLVLPANRVVRR